MKKIIFTYIFIIFYIFNIYTTRWIGRAATFLREANEEESSIKKDKEFKKYKFFAASHNFDIGEVITVINPDTKKSLKVLISDHIKKPTGYMLFLTKETASELGIEWQDDVYVIIEAEEKSLSEDANINEISTVVNEDPPPSVVEDNGETLIAMMIKRSIGDTPPSSIYRNPLEIIKFEDKDRVRFRDTLKSGFYIKISTAYDEEEGLRRLKKFNKIFNSILGYEEDGKYSIVMGPLEEKDIDRELDRIRNFGYIDAIVIKK